MEIEALVLGELGTNCYIIHRPEGTLVIDPADDAARIVQTLQKRGWALDAVVLTHAHFDHMLALNELPVVTVHLHAADAPFLTDSRRNLSAMWSEPFIGAKQPVFLQNGQDFMGFEVLHTPGHTPGGISLYDWKERVLFSGDTLFAGSYGRTDFPGGNAALLMESLGRLLGLPPESRVYTGHGASTKIEAERQGGMRWKR